MAEEPDDEELEAYLRSSLSDRRRSRWGRQSLRRASSPFLSEGLSKQGRRLSSFTTSSGDDTAISMEEEETAEEVKENMRLNKQIIETIKLQPWRMKKKYKILRKAKAYVRKHEGELAQSKRSKDVFAKYTLLWSRGLNRFKREVANFMVMLTPWEMRIKRIESHFGSVVASYFTFLRWVFWINCFISAFVCCFLMVPEVLRGAEDPTGMRKEIESEEQESALNLKNIWDFEGYLKYSPIFYGYYSNQEKTEEGYRVPLAYFLTSICVYIFSFFAILRRMAENSRMSKLSEKDDECIFAWKLFTGWDYMIGNPETAYNKVASLVMGFKEAILEEKEKKKEAMSWQLIAIRLAANFFVLLLLATSAYAVVLVVTRSQEPEAQEEGTWYRQNEVTLVVSFISILFPNLFDIIGMAERYHPRIQLRWQLARILLLYLLNLYTLIFALFVKVYKTNEELGALARNITTSLDLEDELRELQNISTNSITSPNARQLLSIDDLGDLETSTLLLPLNCTLMLVHNCTLAAFYLSSAHTSETTPSPSTPPLVVDGEYFMENQTDSEYEAYDSFVDSLANLTALGIARLNDTAGGVRIMEGGPVLALPPVFLNGSSAMDLVDGKMTWDIPLDYEFFENRTFLLKNLNESLSATFGPAFSTALFYNETESTDSTTESSSTESTPSDTPITTTTSEPTTWPPDLNCTVMIPVCTPLQPTTIQDSDLTTESIEDVTSGGPDVTDDVTLNATDSEANVTSRPPCARKFDEDAPCPKKCLPKPERPKRVGPPSMKDLARVDEKIKDVLRKKCWETAFGQELVKLTIMDLVMTVITTILTDFLRAVFVRYANQCWCWDLEKGFPGYGDFKIAENILHLVNNQGMVWMGMFFSPGLPAINTVKLCMLVYVRSWAVLTANIPHETVFRASRSNNFYYALLLIMLFLCTLPVGFACVWLEPSWHCGPFSQYERIYKVLTSYVLKSLPPFMYEVVEYLTSPGVVIPLLLLLVLIIYYLTSLTGSLREANNDLKLQLRREKGEKEKPEVANAPETVELPEDVTKWSSAKKIIPVLPNKFRATPQIPGEDSDDDPGTPTKKQVKRVQYSENGDDQFEGHEDKKARREESAHSKDKTKRRPSPLSVDSQRSSSEGEGRHWVRRGGITGNGDLPLITISQASEGRDSMSSLNSSDEGTPPLSVTTRRRHGLIPEQDEDIVVEEEEEEEEEEQVEEEMEEREEEGVAEDDVHFQAISDVEEDGEQVEVMIDPEVVIAPPRDRAETKELTGCAPVPRRAPLSETHFIDYDEFRRRSAALPYAEASSTGSFEQPCSGRSSRQSSLQRSKAIKGSDSVSSADSNSLRSPTPDADVKKAAIQRLDTDSL